MPRPLPRAGPYPLFDIFSVLVYSLSSLDRRQLGIRYYEVRPGGRFRERESGLMYVCMDGWREGVSTIVDDVHQTHNTRTSRRHTTRARADGHAHPQHVTSVDCSHKPHTNHIRTRTRTGASSTTQTAISRAGSWPFSSSPTSSSSEWS